ncbi:hypothetical protein [Methylobacterium sp. PvR107]|uniref:hypothetical protein n=1 Tax=Methylobacterium sp. PvR107 TaxID=2806597 RepID=UPI001AE2771B|nr:hypothetical protein [Methylobacterium sp. PvR107]MBP1183029.1 hypothetical protein [Methylobacterium sp. PvR107]
MADLANSNFAPHGPEVQRMIQRLEGFADGLGLDKALTRQIAEQVLADMPMRTDDERLMEARARMIVASA